MSRVFAAYVVIAATVAIAQPSVNPRSDPAAPKPSTQFLAFPPSPYLPGIPAQMPLPPLRRHDEPAPRLQPHAVGETKPGRGSSEWTKCKYVHPLDGEMYQGSRRLLARYSTRFDNDDRTVKGISIGYLSWLDAEEWDDRSHLGVKLVGKGEDSRLHMHFVRKMDEKGLPGRHEIRIVAVGYFDLNGDGVIDAWVDNLGNPYELRNGEVVRAADAKGGAFRDDNAPTMPASRLPVVPEKPKQRVLGPEWIKVKTMVRHGPEFPPTPPVYGEETSYVRPGANVSYRKDNDPTTRHTLMLDQGGGIDVYEKDDSSAITVELIGKKPGDKQLYFNRQVNEKGRPTRHELRFGPVTYFDLNGDGMIDCWVDHRNNKRDAFILFERQVIRVEDAKGALFEKPKGVYGVWGDGRKVEYEFIVPVGKWTLAKR